VTVLERAARKFRHLRSKLFPFDPEKMHRFRLAGQSFEVCSPTDRQLTVMREAAFTEKNLAEHRAYFRALGLKPGATLVDVGANIGYVSLVYSILFPDSPVMALEPSAFNFRFLERNTRGRANVHRLDFGAHESRGTAEIALPSAEQNGRMASSGYENSGLLSMYGKSGKARETIRLQPLDEWADAYPARASIGFVKIDVEGNELCVLKGARRLLSDVGPAVEAEMNPQALAMSGARFADIRSYLAGLGYAPFEWDGARLKPFDAPDVRENINMVFLKGRAS
jgi:FkbM family methyltransferase